MNEADLSFSIKIEPPYKKIRKEIELDPSKYKICEIKILPKGHLKKWIFQVHFDGRGWSILILTPDNKVEAIYAPIKEMPPSYIG